MSNYRKTMTEALREMYSLDESVIDKVKEIASKKSAAKIGGVMVDSFTASAISQIYDKVNDANKKKMEKLPITKLANLAFKMMQKNEFVPEEADLDEGTKQVLAHGGKGKYKVTKDGDKIEIKFGGKVVGTADFDRGADSFFVSMKGEKGQKSFDDAQAIADYFAKNKITEEAELDEAQDGGDFKPHMMYDPKTGKGYKADTMDDHLRMKKMGYTHDAPKKEEVDLDEKAPKMKTTDIMRDRGKKAGPQTYQVDIKGVGRATVKAANEKMAIQKAMTQMKVNKNIKPLPKATVKVVEEVDLDEGKMSQLHQLIKDKKSAEEIAKIMKVDVKTIKALMSSHHPEEVEEGAAADARRAMRRDKDFSRKDSADDDTDATDDDIKGASKNIMMQMRKAQSLNGRFDVEFADGKKVKIPAKMAMAVQSKYNKMRRPAEKEKFQAKVGKSYRDMLSALKEEVKPKKESVLDRIDRKIKEKNDG